MIYLDLDFHLQSRRHFLSYLSSFNKQCIPADISVMFEFFCTLRKAFFEKYDLKEASKNAADQFNP